MSASTANDAPPTRRRRRWLRRLLVLGILLLLLSLLATWLLQPKQLVPLILDRAGKSLGLEIADRIRIYYQATAALSEAIKQYETYIAAETLSVAAKECAPHTLCFYLKDLAGDFHAFYNAERVLVEDEAVRNARLALLLAARQVLRNSLDLLGVSAPEKM